MPRPSGLSSDAPLRLLTRPECGLCEEFEQALLEYGRRHPLPPIQRIDVDSDPLLQRRHGLDIPVLLWGDTVIGRHRFDEAELWRVLRPRGSAIR